MVRAPGGPVQVIVKKVDLTKGKPPPPPLQTKVSLPVSLLVPLTLPADDNTPCPGSKPQQDVILPQFTSFMQVAATGGYSEIKYLFPKFNLDRKVLFGDNFNYRFPTSPQFPVQNLIFHFVYTKLVPLEVGIIVPADFMAAPNDNCTCYAITINDLPFQARVVPFDVLRSTVYAAFTK